MLTLLGAGQGQNSGIPINIVAPIVSGTAGIGQTLSTTNGEWTGEPFAYYYQWVRNGEDNPIIGATNNTYVTTADDNGFNIKCFVSAENTSGISSSQGSSNGILISTYDADYQAILTRAGELGYINYPVPSTAQRTLQNNLLLSLKSGGVWNKLDVFYNFANNGGSGFATLNWKSPSIRQATLISSPIFLSNVGFQGTGTSYIDTNFNPTVGTNNYTLNSSSRYFYLFQNGDDATNVSMDGTSANNRNYMLRSSSAQHRINSSFTLSGGLFLYNATKGMKSFHRTNSNDVVLCNDSFQSSRIQFADILYDSNQYILRGNSSFVYATHKVSMYAMGSNLLTENTAFVNAYNTYITSI